MEPQKILRHKNWNFSEYKPPYLQFLIGWLYNILEWKGLYKQLPAYSWITASWTVPLGLVSVYSVCVCVTANSAKSPLGNFFCCPQRGLAVCCLLPSAVHVFAWAAVLATCATTACCTWQHGNSSGAYSLPPGISPSSFQIYLVWALFLKEQSTQTRS